MKQLLQKYLKVVKCYTTHLFQREFGPRFTFLKHYLKCNLYNLIIKNFMKSMQCLFNCGRLAPFIQTNPHAGLLEMFLKSCQQIPPKRIHKYASRIDPSFLSTFANYAVAGHDG